MTKADIVKRVMTMTTLPKDECHGLVEDVFELVKTTLESGEAVKITRFGIFVLINKKDRPGRNPHTGEVVTVTARRIVYFKPSEILKRAVNQAPE